MQPEYEGYFAILLVSNIEVAREFYEKRLGFRFDKGDDHSAGFFLGEDFLLLLDREGASEMLGAENIVVEESARAGQVLVAPVKDVDAAFVELTSRGVAFLRPPEDRSWGVRCAYFKDPDGHVWELH